MKQSEVVRLVAALRARFPKSSEFTPDNAAAYCTELIDLDYDHAMRVVSVLARTLTWFPSIAEIRHQYAEMLCGFPDPDELWRQVLYWANETAWGRTPAAVPPHVDSVVKFLGGWRELGSAKDLATARAHVMKVHPHMKTRALDRVRVALPARPTEQLDGEKEKA